ncbi:hypothetical protein TcCL_Unassigned01170 [Trypanosoma cruzi]|nr:hypothetical protein TcCL_Unassigned01170 [Trypanosoma cruzi]
MNEAGALANSAHSLTGKEQRARSSLGRLCGLFGQEASWGFLAAGARTEHPLAWICAQPFLNKRTQWGATICFLPRRGHPHGGVDVGEEGCRTCPGLPSHHRRLRVRGLQRTLLSACPLVTLHDWGFWAR